MFRGEHINFLARLTLGQPALCPRAIWTLTWVKSSCLCFIHKRLYCRTPEKWFGGKFSVEWFGFGPKSQSYRPKVGVTDQKSEIQPRIRTESPRKGPRMEFRCFYRKPPLRPSWIHLIYVPFSPRVFQRGHASRALFWKTVLKPCLRLCLGYEKSAQSLLA